MHICTHMCVHTYPYIYTYIFIDTHLFSSETFLNYANKQNTCRHYVYMWMCVHTCSCAFERLCMHMCASACIRAWVIYVHVHMCPCVFVCVHMCVRAFVIKLCGQVVLQSVVPILPFSSFSALEPCFLLKTWLCCALGFCLCEHTSLAPTYTFPFFSWLVSR